MLVGLGVPRLWGWGVRRGTRKWGTAEGNEDRLRNVGSLELGRGELHIGDTEWVVRVLERDRFHSVKFLVSPRVAWPLVPGPDDNPIS